MNIQHDFAPESGEERAEECEEERGHGARRREVVRGAAVRRAWTLDPWTLDEGGVRTEDGVGDEVEVLGLRMGEEVERVEV